ncbi:MAG: hypothetical protein A2096_04100 [Spirochaetes bacterium GWF1_41_5]|nr:MAG: hypothetical protein A2096_04100 [Spirochaetes bacterium GWF1_41_5]
MYKSERFQPETPEFIKQSWLKVIYKNHTYVPCLFRLRKQYFSADEIKTLNPKGYQHFHKIYHFVYYLKGSNTILIDNREIKVRSGQMVLIDPDTYHDVMPRVPVDCTFIVLMIVYRSLDSDLDVPFSELLKLLTGMDIKNELILEDSAGSIRTAFEYMDKYILKNRDRCPEYTGYGLMALFNEIIGIRFGRNNTHQIPDDILTARQHLIENFNKNITIKDLTELTALTRSYLMVKFKRYCGLSPIDFLINERIERAKTYLGLTQQKIKEISLLCGFNSDFYFNKIFKKKTGLTPGEFRKSNSIMIE